MHIRGKSYDPRPYGVETDIHVWIKNSDGDTVFDNVVEDTKMYYEGEWVCGEQYLNGNGGALCYVPSDFERNLLLTSNGNLVGQPDVPVSYTHLTLPTN